MSATYLRRCAGKQRLDSKSEAAARRVSLAADSGGSRDRIKVYRCDQCLGWHVGNAGSSYSTRMRRSGKRPNKRMRGRV